jgi:hypothetical protein
LVAWIYFNNADFVNTSMTSGASQLDTVLVVANILILSAVGLLFAWTFFENVFRTRGRNLLARIVAANIVSLQAELQNHRDEFVHALIGGSANGPSVVSLECFISAAQQCLRRVGIDPVQYTLEAAYVTLKIVAGIKHDDENGASRQLPLGLVTL